MPRRLTDLYGPRRRRRVRLELLFKLLTALVLGAIDDHGKPDAQLVQEDERDHHHHGEDEYVTGRDDTGQDRDSYDRVPALAAQELRRHKPDDAQDHDDDRELEHRSERQEHLHDPTQCLVDLELRIQGFSLERLEELERDRHRREVGEGHATNEQDHSQIKRRHDGSLLSLLQCGR